MSTLLTGKGRFDLSDSDNQIGSLFSIKDLMEILQIEESNESAFSSALDKLELLKDGYVDEKDLYKQWKCLMKVYSNATLFGRSSLDEYILLAIFKRTFPDAVIEQQIKVGSKFVDFMINNHGIIKYVEFDGPTHFIANRERMPEDPQIRIKQVFEETGCELVRWPFWIQRCSRNARILFDNSLEGYGALWTSTKYFSEFSIPNPSDTIKNLTRRFNAEDENGIGYFYEEKKGPRFQPAHSLLSKVIKDKSLIKRFIPNGAKDYKYWLPKELWELLDV